MITQRRRVPLHSQAAAEVTQTAAPGVSAVADVSIAPATGTVSSQGGSPSVGAGLSLSLVTIVSAQRSQGAARASLRRSSRLSGRVSRLPVLVTPVVVSFEYWAALAGGGVNRAPAVVAAATPLAGGNAT